MLIVMHTDRYIERKILVEFIRQIMLSYLILLGKNES